MESDQPVTNPKHEALTSLRQLVLLKNHELGFSFSTAYLTADPPPAAAFLNNSSSINAENTWTGALADEQADAVASEVGVFCEVFGGLEEAIEAELLITPETVDPDSEEAKWPNT